MNVVDSSAWIEYFGDGPNASEFAPAIEATEELIVPSLVIYEVFKLLIQAAGEDAALKAVGTMLAGTVQDLTAPISLEAAHVSISEGLAMADSIILATARLAGATLWTQDARFADLPGVEFHAKA